MGDLGPPLLADLTGAEQTHNLRLVILVGQYLPHPLLADLTGAEKTHNLRLVILVGQYHTPSLQTSQEQSRHTTSGWTYL